MAGWGLTVLLTWCGFFAGAARVDALPIDPAPALATYLGGGGDETFRGIGVDAAGIIHVFGLTTSANFPVVPVVPWGPQAEIPFVAHFDPTGGLLLASRVLPGFGVVGAGLGRGALAFAVDGAGNDYLAGVTADALPVLHAAQPSFGGGDVDAFVAKLDGDGTVLFSTYLGGAGNEEALDLAVDPDGHLHVVGTTEGGFPTTNAAQPLPGGGRDLFVAQFDASGALEYATHLGGAGNEDRPQVATFAGGGAWVVARTTSMDLPVTVGPRPDDVQRSVDGGRTFRASTAPLPERAVTALAASPVAPDTVYAGTQSGRVYRSQDGGDHWTLAFVVPGFAGPLVSLAVERADPSTVYAADGTVFRSRDDGATWAAAGVGLPPSAVVTALVADPSARGGVYAVLGSSGRLFRSDDFGAQWLEVPLPDGARAAPLLLTIDASDADDLLVAAYQHLARSHDRGATWTILEQAFNAGSRFGSPSEIVIDPADPQILYVVAGALARSIDGGAHWDLHAGCLAGARGLSAAPDRPGSLTAVGSLDFHGAAFLASADGGASWGPVGEGNRAAVARATTILTVPGTPSRHWIGRTAGLDDARLLARYDPAGQPVFLRYAESGALGIDAGGDAFLVTQRFDPAGTARAFTPPLVRPFDVTDIAVDASGIVHWLGATYPIDGQAFVAAFDPATPGSARCTVVDGRTPGSMESAPGSRLAIDAGGNGFAGVSTVAGDLALPGAYQSVNAGATDAFVVEIAAGAGQATCPPWYDPPTSDPAPPVPSCGPAACGPGIVGAACRVTDLRQRALCSGMPVPKGLAALVDRRLERAALLLGRAPDAGAARRHRLLRRAQGALATLAPATRRRVRADRLAPRCGERIVAAVRGVRAAIVAATATDR